jgi:hypothetical protein
MFRESLIMDIIIRDKMSQIGERTKLAKLQEIHRAVQGWIITEAIDERERGKYDTLASLQRILCEKPTAYMYVGRDGLCCMTYSGWYVVIPASFWALPLKTIEGGAKLEDLRKELLENPLKYMHRTEDGNIWCMCYGGYYVCVSKDRVSV